MIGLALLTIGLSAPLYLLAGALMFGGDVSDEPWIEYNSPSAPHGCFVGDEWEAFLREHPEYAREAPGRSGVAADLVMDAPSIALDGDVDYGDERTRPADPLALVAIADSWRLVPGRFEPPQVFFSNATIAGVGSGLLLIHGANTTYGGIGPELLPISKARVTDEGVRLTLVRTHGHTIERRDLPPPWQDYWQSLFVEARDVGWSGLQIEGFEHAALVTPDGVISIGEAFEADVGRLVLQGLTLEVPWAEISGVTAVSVPESSDPYDGTVAARDGRVWGPATAILTRPAHVHATAGHVASVRGAVVLQAFNGTDPLIGADVALDMPETTVALSLGERSALAVEFVEHGGAVDGMINKIEIAGPGAPFLFPGEYAPLTRDAVLEDGGRDHIQPRVTVITAGIGSETQVQYCPLDPVATAEPLPRWLGAGSTGAGFIEVRAPSTPGVYPATVRIDGANFEGATFALEIEAR